VEIRNPDKTHLSAVFSLLERCFPGAWSGAEVEDRIFYDPLYDPNHVWMAREQGRVLGFLASVQDGPVGWLKLLAVDAEARRRGIGADLLSRAEFRLSGEGVQELRIAPTPPREFLAGVPPASSEAAFFEAQGFKPAGGLEILWTAPRLGLPVQPVDRAAAAAFGRAHGGAAWHWIEEQLSWRPARAAFDPQAGLCLAEPGVSLGPLWPAPSASPSALAALVDFSMAVAASAPPRRPEGLRVWRVDGSAEIPGLATTASMFNTYSKTLS
jgi:GNAT superfamily N-acetyltransferase